MSNVETGERMQDIAIIGMAGRFPGAQNIEQFWQNIRDGVECITHFTDEELLAAGVPQQLLNDPSYIKAGAIFEGVDQFDAAFFGFNPREAAVIDPQHRVFLESAWEALENAGYNSETYPGAISVFAGTGLNRYLLFNVMPQRERIAQSLGEHPLIIGNDKDFLALRVSYKMNLSGASLNVQSACSTSLVSIHLACQSLLNGESDMAMAGGVTIGVPQISGYAQQSGITSADGHCRAFDENATGTIFGSGVGVVVLKRLSDAIADGDSIYAVIRGSALNNDGSNKVSFTAPSVSGQAAAISEALAIAEVEADTITYVETHGTGTALGDPIEITALTEVFQEVTDEKGFCAVGSVKNNVGHLDTAAGMTGLIKTSLALKHKQLPPTINYERPNPKIDFANSPFYVNTDLQEWKTNGFPRRAGVSSFGFGGTNAHVVLEEAPEREPSGESRDWQLVVLSAKTGTALEQAKQNLKAHLAEHPEENFADAAYTLQVGRQAFAHRSILVARDAADAVQVLEQRDPKRLFTTQHDPDASERPVMFMFSGTGSQYVNMGLELYRTEAVFRDQVDLCCDLLRPHLGLDLRTIMYPENEADERAAEMLNQTAYAQPALFVIEYAMSQLWMEWGVAPQAMIGHSLGEYVAACMAGVFSLEDALAIVAKRAQMIQGLPDGAMLAVHLPEADLRPMLAADLSLAVINGAAQCVVAGSKEAVDRFEQQLQAKEIGSARVHTVSAFHSHLVDPILEEFARMVGGFERNEPQIPYVSNVTGTWITAEEATDPGYWARHLRQTVRFADGVRELAAQPGAILLEVGPGKTLASFAMQVKTDDGQPRAVFTSIRHIKDKQSDVEFLLTSAGKLWLSGVQIDWAQFSAEEQRYRVALPTYPFERQRYWIEPQAYEEAGRAQAAAKPYVSEDPADWFYAPIWKQTPPMRASLQQLAAEPRRWLVFADSSTLSRDVIAKLEGAGQPVVTVQIGEQFAKLSESLYAVHPQKAGDYAELMRSLRDQEEMPNAILHFWSLGANEPAAAQDLGFYSMLYLTQALGKQAVSEPVSIWTISDALHELDSRDLVVPDKATMLGIGKVIQQEYTNITCRIIDVLQPEPGSRLAGKFADQLLAEFAAEDRERMVAYRGNQRFIQTFETVDLTQSLAGPSRLQERGVYLIAGGFGLIGGKIAEYLAETVQARLVLTARAALPPRSEWENWLTSHEESDAVSARIRRVHELEQMGAEVAVVAASIENEQEMRAAIREAKELFGGFNGVIHAAGVSGHDAVMPIAEADPSDCDRHFLPKMQGVKVLDRVLEGETPDFCLIVSSLASVLGGIGCAAYSAAHLFIDSFVGQQARHTDTPWLSFNWDDKTLDLPQEIFGRAVAHDSVVPFAVSTRDLDTDMEKWIYFSSQTDADQTAGDNGSLEVHARPNLLTAYAEPSNETEELIASFWQELLGIDLVGIHDNFFELGGNSLLATKLVTRLRNEFEIDLPLRILFEASTVEDLALVVEDLVIAQITALSEEEIASTESE